MNTGFKYKPSESYYEEESREVGGVGAQMESYDPVEDDGDIPYIPTLGVGKSMQPSVPTKQITEAFIDVNNMNQYVSNQQTDGGGVDKYQQTYKKYQMEAEAEPTFMNAQKRFGQMKDILGAIGELQPDATGDESFAIDAAIKSIRGTIDVLGDVALWLPKGKEEYVPALERIAKPVLIALKAYAQKLGELK